MSVVLKHVSYFEVVTTEGTRRGGRTVPVTLTVDGTIHDQTVSIANNATTTLFDSTVDIPDFDYLYIVSDQTGVYLELMTDQSNNVGDERSTVKLTANFPFILSSDDSYANYVTNFGGGAVDVIDLIRAQNKSGVTATVRIFAIT